MDQKKKKFVVECVNTFYEVHIVEAKDESEAKFIAENSDYNASKWLGQQISNISEFDDRDLSRLKQLDSYFYDGCAKLDVNGIIIYEKK